MADTTDQPGGDRRMAYLALLGCTIGVGAVTFVLSFVGLRDFAERVVGFDRTMSWLVPVGVDGLTLCAVAATMIVRHGRWHVRLYTWSVFGVAVAASVAGNLSHAQALGLTWHGHIGAGAWPVFLALSSHLVIVVRRHMERERPTASVARPGRSPVRQPAATSAPPETTPAVAPATRPPRSARRQRTGGRDNDLTRQQARAAYRRGNTDLSAIATRLGVSKRSVERYTADLRQTPAATNTPTGDDDGEREAA
jgi:hypothetical protein